MRRHSATAVVLALAAALTACATPAWAQASSSGRRPPAESSPDGARPPVADSAPAGDRAGVDDEGAAGVEIGRLRDKDWIHAMWTISQLRAAPSQGPVVYLLGGSSVRECTVSDESLSAAVSAGVGEPVVAFDLGTRNQTFGQTEQVLLHLPHVPSLVFIGLNQSRFDLSRTHTKLTLPSPGSPEPPGGQHYYGSASVLTLAQKRAAAKTWMKSKYPVFRARYPDNLAALRRILRDCAARPWLHAVLVDSPRDMAAIGILWRAPITQFHRDARRLSSEFGVPYLDFVTKAGLVDEDYADLSHLVESGRPKFQAVLTSNAVRLLLTMGLVAGS
jgi:hypothetical protein